MQGPTQGKDQMLVVMVERQKGKGRAKQNGRGRKQYELEFGYFLDFFSCNVKYI